MQFSNPDIFISYKSEDINIVRKVTDILIANGLKVWLVEYNVPISEYDNFQEYIDCAIAQARYALIFTNNKWAQSAYCEHEIQAILDRLEIKILMVDLPHEAYPRQKYPKLEDVPSFEFDNDIIAVIYFIDAHTDFNLSSPVLPLTLNSETGNRWELPSYGLGLNLGQFVPTSSIAAWIMTKNGLPGGLITQLASKLIADESLIETGYFTCEIQGFNVTFIITYYPSITTVPDISTNDDRAIYRKYMRHAGKWLKNYRYDEQGLHLFRRNNQYHLGLTYKVEKGWERRYILKVANTLVKPHKKGEIHFSFMSENVSGLNTPEAIHLLYPYFEDIVGSLEFKPELNTASPKPMSNIISILFAVLGFVIIYTGSSQDDDLFFYITGAFFVFISALSYLSKKRK